MTLVNERFIPAQPESEHTLWRFLREHSLSLVMTALFLLALAGQSIAGYLHHNEDQQQHSQPAISYLSYLTSGAFIEATAENWESEFLQMAMFVFLTAFLIQKGSPESNDPDKEEPEVPVTASSPWPARAGGWIKSLYAYSLSIAFALLFLSSITVHAIGGAAEHNRQRLAEGEPAITVLQYIGTSQFWFESFQNWQSEFLAIAAMVLLAVFLRHKGSPESKSVATPTWENET